MCSVYVCVFVCVRDECMCVVCVCMMSVLYVCMCAYTGRAGEDHSGRVRRAEQVDARVVVAGEAEREIDVLWRG